MASVTADRETGVALPRRGRDNQIRGRSGKPLLVVVGGSDIDAMVEAGLQAIGGLGQIIGAHREVLLKPNTNQRDPFPSITAPETIRAVARHCVEAGAERVLVHEDHKRELDLYYRPEDLPGLEIILSHAPTRDDFVLVEYEGWHGDMEVPPIPEDEPSGPGNKLPSGLPPSGRQNGGGMLQRLRDYTPDRGPRLRLARQIQAAGVVINLPVLKRHFAGQITSALKNHFGSVAGPHRWLAHSQLQSNRDYYDRKLVEFASAVRPELTITDIRAIQAVTGPGRDEHTRIVEGVNRLLMSGDMVAADAMAMELMKQYDSTFTVENEAIVRRQHHHAEELGLGTGDLSKVEIIEVSA